MLQSVALDKDFLPVSEIPAVPIIMSKSRDGEYLSINETAKELKVNRATIYRWLDSGHLKSVRRFGTRGSQLIPWSECERLRNPNVDQVTYVEYRGSNYPHMSFFMHIVLETSNSRKDIIKWHDRYRLVTPSESDQNHMWEALQASAPPVVKRRIRGGKMGKYYPKAWDKWLKQIGIYDLQKEPFWSCTEILEDHSEARLRLECLLCGRVQIAEIATYLTKKYSRQWTEQQILFFATHFFNTFNFTDQHFIEYTRRLPGKEKMLKLNSFDNPAQAKIQFDIPTAVNLRENLTIAVNLAVINMKRLLPSPSLEEMDAGVHQTKLMISLQDQMMKVYDHNEKLRDQAYQDATKDAPDITFEKEPASAPDFSELKQETPDADEKEAEAKAG